MKCYVPCPPGNLFTFENAKPFFIIDNLNELNGPERGIIHLPIHIKWSGETTFDINNTDELYAVYSNVIREAASEVDLAKFLNPELLTQHWNDLKIPNAIRQAWENQHTRLVAYDK